MSLGSTDEQEVRMDLWLVLRFDIPEEKKPAFYREMANWFHDLRVTTAKYFNPDEVLSSIHDRGDVFHLSIGYPKIITGETKNENST
jgi:hypothetical protein